MYDVLSEINLLDFYQINNIISSNFLITLVLPGNLTFSDYNEARSRSRVEKCLDLETNFTFFCKIVKNISRIIAEYCNNFMIQELNLHKNSKDVELLTSFYGAFSKRFPTSLQLVELINDMNYLNIWCLVMDLLELFTFYLEWNLMNSYFTFFVEYFKKVFSNRNTQFLFDLNNQNLFSRFLNVFLNIPLKFWYNLTCQNEVFKNLDLTFFKLRSMFCQFLYDGFEYFSFDNFNLIGICALVHYVSFDYIYCLIFIKCSYHVHYQYIKLKI